MLNSGLSNIESGYHAAFVQTHYTYLQTKQVVETRHFFADGVESKHYGVY